MRRNFIMTLLIIGTIAGYSSGIYSVVTRDRDGWRRGRGCEGRHGQAEWSSWRASAAADADDDDEQARAASVVKSAPVTE